MAPSWLLLQLSDSAFPTGGFAHSYGLEATAQLGELASDREALTRHARDFLWQLGHAGLPLVTEGHGAAGHVEGESARLACLDARAEAFLVGEVPNAASRTQGRAFFDTCARIFPVPLQGLAEALRARHAHLHHAPLFGAVLARLGVERADTQRLYLSLGLRGLCSAAVRLNLAGTHEAQALQHALGPTLERVHEACAPLGLSDLAQTAPLQDLFGSLHDRLYSRLFLS